jgi:membrane-bound lytic murein transglycosylase D
MNTLRTTLLLLLSLPVFAANGPQVPEHMHFADMKLHIDSRARRQIQEDVDAIRRNATYFQRRLDKIDMYFPIIERVFREENLPEDFKYLVIQESALEGDAVSRSMAVGYWQFKEATALEMGLRVDRHIDERKNIVSSTRAAARYLKKNYAYLENWLYALLAYNTGLGGVEPYLDNRYRGAKNMHVTASTHWYIKKFLAHKIAYENEVNKRDKLPLVFYEFTDGTGMALDEIAESYRTDRDMLKMHNHWLLRGTIPDDKQYTALVPLPPDQVPLDMVAVSKRNSYDERKDQNTIVPTRHNISSDNISYAVNAKYPVIERTEDSRICRINNMPGAVARTGDTPRTLADLGGIPVDRFLRFNDMVHGEAVQIKQVYYFKRKRSKAKVHFHVVEAGETLWDISQKYGLRLTKLLRKNRMISEHHSAPGRVLWLRFIRPSETPIEYKKVRPEKETEQIARAEFANPNIANVDVSGPAGSPVQTGLQRGEKEEAAENGYIHEGTYIRLGEDKPLPDSPVVAGPDDLLHEVQAGETLFSITQRYQVPLGELRDWNKLDITAPIHPGQKILIKNAAAKTGQHVESPEDERIIIHKVKSSETLYGIARKYGVEVRQIMFWNNKKDFKVDIDEELTIYVR